jgi:hypothetical protein
LLLTEMGAELDPADELMHQVFNTPPVRVERKVFISAIANIAG